MTHEKIFTRSDGTRHKIIVSLRIDFSDKPKWDYTVLQCAPKKRTWFGVIDEDDYSFRGLSIEARDTKRKASYSKVVTKEEIAKAKIELWEKLAPLD